MEKNFETKEIRENIGAVLVLAEVVDKINELSSQEENETTRNAYNEIKKIVSDLSFKKTTERYAMMQEIMRG